MREVYADLMRAPGEWFAGDLAEGTSCVRPPPQATEVGGTGATLRMNRALQPDGAGFYKALTDDGLIDIDFLPLGMSVNHGNVSFFRLAVLQAHRQGARGFGVLSHKNQAAGFTIQSGDDCGFLAICHFKREQLLEAAEQGGLHTAIGGMNDQGRGLGDDDVVVTFINHGKFQDRFRAFVHEISGRAFRT